MDIQGTGAAAPLLSLTGITKTWPGVVALDDVSVSFAAGEVHAVIGENGAGKSTLIKTIAGAIAPDTGRIAIAGQGHDSLTPALSRALGIEVIYQEFNLVPTLSVAENIWLGQPRGWRADRAAQEREAAVLLSDLGVAIPPATLVRDLPSSQQQLVEIAKAIAKRPRILIMDEPTAPLSMAEVESLFAIIRKARATGTCILYVSHRMDEIFAICDRITVLRDGRFVKTLATADTDRDELVRLMVGREVTRSYPDRPAPRPEIALELKGLAGNGNAPISFALHRGEVLGVAGLVGAGRTELAKVICGAVPADGGTMMMNGAAVRFRSPGDALKAGLGLVPENRKEEGVFLEKPIRWNIAIAALRRLSRLGLVNRRSEDDLAARFRDRLRIKAPSLDQRVKNLSGGNQQKVVIAKTLAAEAGVIIFDEPTRGIDVGARAEVYGLMAELAAEGLAILMISSDMEELLGMSDRILVLHQGRAAGLIPRAGATPERVLSLASGLAESAAA
ncbi:sugar ABC transporter ATP-binding protein [Neotabrizicola shimadae]|uniref:Sugar ABC transporter ATP-binding protein n=1 Tax=Neotabrizicola shimadae TaxID=2807096 RepID=A0A8G0ZUC6_9RHOB|nr:sugar ABC transporter ATP-binding protein [Neotabrizicola shimadae]QYZ69605.1 sugar ABC transporter ATP-binding protein [Neotabrizicola shimadae]